MTRPAVRLEMISPFSRSDASARAAVARSCALSFVTASCSAADRNAASAPAPLNPRRDSRAAAANFNVAKVNTATSAATIAVRPSRA